MFVSILEYELRGCDTEELKLLCCLKVTGLKKTVLLTRMNTSKIVIQIQRSTRDHLPRVQLPIREQFRQIIFNLIQAAMVESAVDTKTIITQTGLRKTVPYWYPYTTMAKMRWLGRELLEVVSTEFRDRSMEYYVRCCQ